MRIQLLTTAFLATLSFATAQFTTTSTPGPYNPSCLTCVKTRAQSIHPACTDTSIVTNPQPTPDPNFNPWEHFKSLSPQERACQCSMSVPGFFDSCAPVCGPLSNYAQSQLRQTSEFCEIFNNGGSGPTSTSTSTRVGITTRPIITSSSSYVAPPVITGRTTGSSAVAVTTSGALAGTKGDPITVDGAGAGKSDGSKSVVAGGLAAAAVVVAAAAFL